MRVAIIGAGPAGMTAAYVLSKNKIDVDVYESSSKIGGMCASIELWNQKVDLGPHRFFSIDKDVNKLWLEVVGEEYSMVKRQTRIFYNGKFFEYPLQLNGTLKNLGIIEATRCITSFLFQKIKPLKEDGSFQNWVEKRFGKRLFTIFFKSYTEKLWGISCKELDSDFASQRIKKLSLFEAIKNALLRGKRNRHKTLVSQFAYPHGGTGMVYEKMANLIKCLGNNIYLNSPVYRVVNYNGKVIGIELEDGTFKECEHVISTMPYNLLVRRLTEAPEFLKSLASKLAFRNTIIVYLLVNSDNVFPDNWIYIHSSHLKMGRITNFNNWGLFLNRDKKKTILAIEFWCSENSQMWTSADRYLIDEASTEVVKSRLVDVGQIEDGKVLRIGKSYPVYQKGYRDIVSKINQYLESIENLAVIGRYGSFKYNNQDHSMLMGIRAAENIISKAGHNLFEINSDYETYQESYIITETGLQKQ